MTTLKELKKIVKDWNHRENLKWLKEQRQMQYRQALELALELRDELYPILSCGNYHAQLAPIRSPLHIRPVDHREKNGIIIIGFEILKTSQQRILAYELEKIAIRINNDIAIDIAPLLANPYIMPTSLLLRQPQVVEIRDMFDSIKIFIILQ